MPWDRGLCLAPAALVFCVTAMVGQKAESADTGYDPRDLSGVWWVADPGSEKMLERGRKGDASRCETCHVPEHATPEPPLTALARKYLGMPSRSMHAASKCEPVGIPAQFWYTQLAPFEFVVTRGRLLQFFEKNREWRVVWLGGNQPWGVPESGYMGHSTGRWEGDTLVVETTGFNGKGVVEPVGPNYRVSDAFRVVERWRRTSRDRLEFEAKYSDPVLWGDVAWDSLKKTFVLQPDMELNGVECSLQDNEEFDRIFIEPYRNRVAP